MLSGTHTEYLLLTNNLITWLRIINSWLTSERLVSELISLPLYIVKYASLLDCESARQISQGFVTLLKNLSSSFVCWHWFKYSARKILPEQPKKRLRFPLFIKMKTKMKTVSTGFIGYRNGNIFIWIFNDKHTNHPLSLKYVDT